VLVAIAVTSASVVTLVGSIAAVEKDAGVATSQAQVELTLRSVADALRSNGQYPYLSSGEYGVSQPAGFSVSLAIERPQPSGASLTVFNNKCPDYGVQRITITVGQKNPDGSAGPTQASRVIWKSYDGSQNGPAGRCVSSVGVPVKGGGHGGDQGGGQGGRNG
jgi:hypothetical protein